ncbi:MAG: CHASE2 domain-containing protein [Gammaproteobacteria bacterium]|nr:CHASE2 domain-containing protein [Gammaproteobacteria bacterium]
MNRKLVPIIVDLLLLRHLTRLVARLRSRKRDVGNTSQTQSTDDTILTDSIGKRSSGFWHHVAKNLIIGLTITVGLHLAHSLHLSMFVSVEDYAMDFVMRQFRNIASRKGENTAFVLLEVDQAAFQEWDEPFYLHRDRVKRLIERAVAGTPALIIVDIDLSKRGRNDESGELKRYLERYAAQSNPPNPPLVLVRTLRNWPPNLPEGYPLPQRSSFLDPVVDAADNIFWASPHFQRDEDYRVRRWWLWLATCTEGRASALPSVQLLSQLLLDETDERPPAEKHKWLKDILVGMTPSCNLQDAEPRKDSKYRESNTQVIDIRGHEVDLRGSLLSQRLIYSIPYEETSGVNRPTVWLDNRNVRLFEHESALRIDQMDPGFLAGRVVVIGGTYRETRDWYATPIGEMPGAMVVINAVHSLGVNGQLRLPSVWTKLIVEALLIIMMSIVFACLSSLLGYLLSSVLILIGLVPISFLMFRSGVWIDFALPLLAVQLHEFAAEFESEGATSGEKETSHSADVDGNASGSHEEPASETTKDEDAAV